MSGRIVVLTPPEVGACSVCADTAFNPKPVLTRLRFLDRSTGMKFGRCFQEAMVFTDQMLDLHGRRFGIDHPTP